MAASDPPPSLRPGENLAVPAGRNEPPPKPKVIGDLKHVCQTCNIIDQHAHCLHDESKGHPPALKVIFTEATGDAQKDVTSTLALMRGVDNLAQALKCEPSLSAVEKAITGLDPEERRKLAFRRVETVLFDDGLQHPAIAWHKHAPYMRTHPKRIVRIEALAEKLAFLPEVLNAPKENKFDIFMQLFQESIIASINNRDDVAFKSIMAYRCSKGLGWYWQDISDEATKQALCIIFLDWIHKGTHGLRVTRLAVEFDALIYFLVQTTCHLMVTGGRSAKPFQFHTGFGDRDIKLVNATPLLMESLIKKYRRVDFVLLHAGYPYVRETGIMASLYENVWVDFGLIFPMLSRMGQQAVLQQLLEVSPTNRLMYSSDGHYLPESFLVANTQAREVVQEVLISAVRHKDMTVEQGIEIAIGLFFGNANDLYGLGLVAQEVLPEIPVYPYRFGIADTESPEASDSDRTPRPTIRRASSEDPVCCLSRHCHANGLPSDWTPANARGPEEDPRTMFDRACLFLRVCWTDYGGQLRYRVLPRSQVVKQYPDLVLTVTKAAMSLLPDDHPSGDSTPVGKLLLKPDWDTLRPLDTKSTPGHFMVMSKLELPLTQSDTGYYSVDPRTILARAIKMAKQKAELRVGFETEFVLYDRREDGSLHLPRNGHAWSSSGALDPSRRACMDNIVTALEKVGIEVLMYHAESAQSQFEIVTGHMEPMAAVETLYYTRQVIRTIAGEHGMRATLHPKPDPNKTGTASHMHFSLKEPFRKHQEQFMAGVFKHLPALMAFGLPSVCSYSRLMDSNWCGGTWLCWGEENRETPMRRVSKADAHWEIRCLDGTANLYLFLAALIHAGLDGIEGDPRVMKLPTPCQDNPQNMTELERVAIGVVDRVPMSLTKAIAALKKDVVLTTKLGKDVIAKYQSMKEEEVVHMDKLEKAKTADGKKKWELERY